MTTYFISRHPGARAWAEQQGIRIERFVGHLDIRDLHAGDLVMGSLPVHLAAEVCGRGARYFHLSINLPPELRGRELSAEELSRCGANLQEFVVTVPERGRPGSA